MIFTRFRGILFTVGLALFMQPASVFAQTENGGVQKQKVSEKSALDENLEELMKTFPSRMSREAVPTLQELQENMYTGKPLVFKGTGMEGQDAGVMPSGQNMVNYNAQIIAGMQEKLAQSEKDAIERSSKTKFFSSRLYDAYVQASQAREQWQKYQKNRLKFYQSDFPGQKTVITIPPDNLVEVPLSDHIPYMFSRIEILGNGSISVTETVQRVVSPRITNFYGLNRYFPYEFENRAGDKVKTKITLISATHNNEPITPKLLPSLFGYRVSMEGDYPLPAGVHVYKWQYILSNQVSDYKEFKELVYSITGNHWFFPVTRAGAYVIFPQATQVVSQGAATGNSPLTDDLYRIKKDANGDLSFTLRYPLGAAEEFTITVNFKEKMPTFSLPQGFFEKLFDTHAPTFACFVMFALVFSYYAATWYSIKKNQITSLQNMKSSQKDDFIPAVLRFALNKQTDAKNFFIVLLSMATKGFLAFSEQGNGDFLLIKQTDSLSKLNALEKKIAQGLFLKSETSFAVSQGNTLKMERLFAKLAKYIQKDYAQKYVTVYITYFLFGILMTATALGFISGIGIYGMTTALTALAVLTLSVAAYLVGVRLYDEVRLKSGWFVKSVLGAALVYLIFPVFVLLWFFAEQTTFLAAFFFLATIICIVVFYTLLKSPSMLGRSVLDSLDAYKMYLSAQSSLPFAGMQNVEAKMKLLYDKHLPFAFALDLEEIWTLKFTSASDKPASLKPSWYKGKIEFNKDFPVKLYECFALRFPKKTYYFGKGRKTGGFRKQSKPPVEKRRTD